MTTHRIKYGDSGGTEVYLECNTSRVNISKLITVPKRTAHDGKRDLSPKPKHGNRITIPEVGSVASSVDAGQTAITALKTLIGTGHNLTLFGEIFPNMYIEHLTPKEDPSGLTVYDVTFLQDTTG